MRSQPMRSSERATISSLKCLVMRPTPSSESLLPGVSGRELGKERAVRYAIRMPPAEIGMTVQSDRSPQMRSPPGDRAASAKAETPRSGDFPVADRGRPIGGVTGGTGRALQDRQLAVLSRPSADIHPRYACACQVPLAHDRARPTSAVLVAPTGLRLATPRRRACCRSARCVHLRRDAAPTCRRARWRHRPSLARANRAPQDQANPIRPSGA